MNPETKPAKRIVHPTRVRTTGYDCMCGCKLKASKARGMFCEVCDK